MRIGKTNDRTKALGLLLTLASCAFPVSLSTAVTNSMPDNLQKAAQAAPPVIDVTRLQFSAGLGEILKMVKANVSPAVILTFIDHSAVSYHPSAQEIIALKKLGVSNEIVTKLLGHRQPVSENPPRALQLPPVMRAPEPEDTPRFPPPRVSGPFPIPPYVYPVRAFAAFGPVSSFNNSYPTFLNGNPIYTGYYLPSYPVLW